MRTTGAVLALLAAGAAVAAGAGCGSSKPTKVEVITVTHQSGTSTPQTSSSSASTATTPPSTTTTSTSTSTSTGSTITTPATAPASATTGGHALAAALATVSAKGYTPTVTYGYTPSGTLGVILATHSSGEQRAFFFVDGRYIGTDTKDPSAGITLVGHDDTSATLSYALYKPTDSLSSPSGHASVTYTLDNGKLEPQQSIPPSSTTAALSRR